MADGDCSDYNNLSNSGGGNQGLHSHILNVFQSSKQLKGPGSKPVGVKYSQVKELSNGDAGGN